MIKCSWADIKSQANSRDMPLQFLEFSTYYVIDLLDGGFHLRHIMDKEDPAHADQTDFEDNFKDDGNKSPISSVVTTAHSDDEFIQQPKDSDGHDIVRLKYAPSGWTFNLYSFEFETSVLNSVYDKDATGSNHGNVTLKLYDDEDTEITTQGTADTDCVCTDVDFFPTWDYEVVGGTVRQASVPTNDIRLWVVGVPDVPANLGGSKEMISGINCKFLGVGDEINADGKASKYMKYDATYKTNKLRFRLKHNAGDKYKFMVSMYLYKA